MEDESDGSVVVSSSDMSSFDLAKLDEIKQDIRRKAMNDIEEIADEITTTKCEKMGSGECKLGDISRYLPYFDYPPALIALCTAKFSTKRVWQLHEGLQRIFNAPRGNASASVLAMRSVLDTLRTHYDELIFRRDRQWLVKLDELTEIALGDPLEVVPNLVRTNITENDGVLSLEITNPFNADIICGFGRLVCREMAVRYPEENIWNLPITGHYFQNSPRRKRKRKGARKK